MSYVVDVISEGVQLEDSGIIEDGGAAHKLFDDEIERAKVNSSVQGDMFPEITVRLIRYGYVVNEATVVNGEVLSYML